MTNKEKLRQIKELSKSPGWSVICEQITKEIYELAVRGSSPTARSSIEDIHFQRGAIYTATLLLDLPEKLASSLTTAVLIEDAANLKRPAKAGHGDM